MLKIATWDDYVYIKRMCLNFAKASPYSDVTIDIEKLEEIIGGMIDEDKTKVIVVLGLKDNIPVGIMAAQTSEMLFNRELMAQEVVYWIEPEHRGGRLALELLEAFEFWAKKVGCKYLNLSALETEHIDKVSKLYNRRGYDLSERAFLKRIN